MTKLSRLEILQAGVSFEVHSSYVQARTCIVDCELELCRVSAKKSLLIALWGAIVFFLELVAQPLVAKMKLHVFFFVFFFITKCISSLPYKKDFPVLFSMTWFVMHAPSSFPHRCEGIVSSWLCNSATSHGQTITTRQTARVSHVKHICRLKSNETSWSLTVLVW